MLSNADKKSRFSDNAEANFLVDAARIKLKEISAQLKREVKQSSNKKAVAELFVHFLTEWLNGDDSDSPSEVDGVPMSKDKLDKLEERKRAFVGALYADDDTKNKPSFDRHFVADTLASGVFDSLRAKTERFCINTLHDNVTVAEVRASALTLLASREMKPADDDMLRRVANEGDKLASEYACLLTILLKNFDNWEWNENEPLDGRVLYYRIQDKFRLIASEDTVNALFLEVLGRRWSEHLKSALPTWPTVRGQVVYPDFKDTDYKDAGVLFDEFWRTESEKMFLTALPSDGDDDSDISYSTEHMERLIMAVATTHKFNSYQPSKTRALGLVKSDIKNLATTVNHDATLTILKCIGTTDKWLAFFGKYIKEWNVEVAGKIFSPTDGRGILLAHTLSHVCTELLLYLLDLSMAEIGHPLLRVHDDFVFYGRGTEGLETAWLHCMGTLRKLGLQPNLSKTSAIFLPGGDGEESPPVLDTDSCLRDLVVNPFVLKGLVLDRNGFKIDEGLLDRLIEPLNPDGVSVFVLINQYNSQLRMVRKQLGPVCSVLGVGHAEGVVRTMRLAEQRLCGATDSWEDVEPELLLPSHKSEPPIVSWLSKELASRFPTECSDPDVLQPGWFFWPVAAGGMYAEHASLRAESVARSLKNRSSSYSYLAPPSQPSPRKWEEYLEWRKVHNACADERKEVESQLAEERESARVDGGGGAKSCPFKTMAEYDACRSYERDMSDWAYTVKYTLSGLVDLHKICEEAPPVVEDRQLRDLISSFTARTEEFEEFGGHTTRGLGGYMKNLVSRYGSDLQSTFGTLGLIPADLAPHSLLNMIRGERKSKELP